MWEEKKTGRERRDVSRKTEGREGSDRTREERRQSFPHLSIFSSFQCPPFFQFASKCLSSTFVSLSIFIVSLSLFSLVISLSLSCCSFSALRLRSYKIRFFDSEYCARGCIAYLLQVSEDATKRKMIFAMNVDGVGLYLPDARVILHSHFNIMFVFLR